jgi:hypothetical protein
MVIHIDRLGDVRFPKASLRPIDIHFDILLMGIRLSWQRLKPTTSSTKGTFSHKSMNELGKILCSYSPMVPSPSKHKLWLNLRPFERKCNDPQSGDTMLQPHCERQSELLLDTWQSDNPDLQSPQQSPDADAQDLRDD